MDELETMLLAKHLNCIGAEPKLWFREDLVGPALKEVHNKARQQAFKEAVDIARAIDSERGNEAEIARAIDNAAKKTSELTELQKRRARNFTEEPVPEIYDEVLGRYAYRMGWENALAMEEN